MINITTQEPDHRLLRWFYNLARSINMSLSARTIIFVVVYVMVFINVAMDILTATGEKNK